MSVAATDPAQSRRRPLCVDLDGTLTKVDTLYDSLMLLVRKNPRALLELPGWLAGGKANLKARLTQAVSLDVARLPYNEALLGYLRTQREMGRSIYLATGADRDLAVRVAAHLGLFDGVLASDGASNLTGKTKLAKFRQYFNNSDFDYIGNSVADLDLLVASAEPKLANPSMALRGALRSHSVKVDQSFIDRAPFFPSVIRAIRVHQWAKNVLIFLPFILGHKWSLSVAGSALLAFLCFSFCASGTYLINDLLDMEADRHHVKKRMRPFAAGDLSVLTGIGISALLIVLSAVCLLFLPLAFTAWMGIYFVSTLAYSFYFKRMVLLDVLALSGLYTVRLMAGGAATSTPISHWLSGFSIFLFLSLAIVKRFAELQNTLQDGLTPKNGRGYQLSDIEQMRSFGTASAFASVVVFANYISGFDVIALYHQPRLLWLVMPLLILWLCRVWLLASRGDLNEDPVVFALTDRMSLLIGACVAVIALLAQ
jgi:4-hydroxybenzoate polyprenyltransferase